MGEKDETLLRYQLWSQRASIEQSSSDQRISSEQNMQLSMAPEAQLPGNNQVIIPVVSQVTSQPLRSSSPESTGHASTSQKQETFLYRTKQFIFRPVILMPLIATSVSVAMHMRFHERNTQLLRQSLALQRINEQLLRAIITSPQGMAVPAQQLAVQQDLVIAADAQLISFELPGFLKEKINNCALV